MRKVLLALVLLSVPVLMMVRVLQSFRYTLDLELMNRYLVEQDD